jgi:dihydrofolate reductase
LKHLRQLTETVSIAGKVNAVILGRKTYESLPANMRPLKNRLNVIISSSTRQEDYPNGVLLFSTVQAAVVALNSLDNVEGIFFLGGEKIYEAAISEGHCDRAVLTRIGKSAVGGRKAQPRVSQRDDADGCFMTGSVGGCRRIRRLAERNAPSIGAGRGVHREDRAGAAMEQAAGDGVAPQACRGKVEGVAFGDRAQIQRCDARFTGEAC